MGRPTLAEKAGWDTTTVVSLKQVRLELFSRNYLREAFAAVPGTSKNPKPTNRGDRREQEIMHEWLRKVINQGHLQENIPQATALTSFLQTTFFPNIQ